MGSLKKPNRLINATSPYLLQHAYNPVDWFEWGEEALQRAKAEDKPILVSIGYSSCHWCHVMERECFEKENIAQVMNEYFVCIKVDREERPDIDQVYMEAVQAMNINGGWPLNVFLMPDQSPFYGGTYFPPQSWMQVLTGLHNAYTQRRTEVDESARSLREHLSQTDIERFKRKRENVALTNDLDQTFTRLQQRFDDTWGGLDKAPKFVMPSVWHWLLRYHRLTGNEAALNHTILTLKRVGAGGIYDQVGGGFARYSVDKEWFAPHFEKMLYDNAQLMSLYSEAFSVTQDPEFKKIVYETFTWLTREMTHPNGAFFSALDADSEGEEGKFYVWKKEELDALLKDDAALISDYYSVEPTGNWEHGKNILWRTQHDDAFLKRHILSPEEFVTILERAKRTLLQNREKRPRPGLDDKAITAWNALMICGLTDAYKAFGDDQFLVAAIENMRFLSESLALDGKLFRSYKGKRSDIGGFLDDYAYVTLASIKLYQVTFDEAWLQKAHTFMTTAMELFYDKQDGFFSYSSREGEALIANKKEIFDNVIPSSNSVMAQNLLYLGILFDNDEWKSLADTMTSSLSHLAVQEPNYMSNWAIVYTEIKNGMAEFVVVGNDAEDIRREFHKTFQPFALTMGTSTESNLPLLEGKTMLQGKSTIYVCYDKTCKAPVHSLTEAVAQLS